VSEAKGTFPRRTFLRVGAAVAALSTMPLSLARAAAAATRPRIIRSTFTPLRGSTFCVTGEGEHFNVVLAEINDLGPSSRTGDEDRFSLVFEGPADHPRIEGIRTLSNSKIGDVSLFIAPIDRGVRAFRLQSVINRK
jgi:hypothetical protein